MTWSLKNMALAVIAGLLALSLAAVPVAAKDTAKGRWLKIRVFEKGATTPTVLVNLPMSLVTTVLRIAARTDARVSVDAGLEGSEKTRLRVKDFDLDAFAREIDGMEPGQIVEIQNGDDRVSIWIE